MPELKPLQAEFRDRHPSTVGLLRWLDCSHITRDDLKAVFTPFQECARQVVTLSPDGPELTVSLRHIVDAKDAAVRANVDR